MVVLHVGGDNPYTAQGTFPRRGGGKLSGTCIVHTSEGNWQRGVDSLTNLIKTRGDYGAYHRAVDWADIAIYFDWEWESWQDSETNPWAVGIAAACKTSDWGNPAFILNDIEEAFYRNLARCGADFVLYMKVQKRITVPLKRITGAQARAQVPGFCAHGDSGLGRTDPGSNFDWARFFRYVQDELNGTPANPVVETTPVVEAAPSVEEEIAMKMEDLKAVWSDMGNSADRGANFEWIAKLIHQRRVQLGADPKRTTSLYEFLQWIPSGLNNLSVKLDTIILAVGESNKVLKEIKALLEKK